jgi:hypothetical protein
MRRACLAFMLLLPLLSLARAGTEPQAEDKPPPSDPWPELRVEIVERGLYNTQPGTTRLLPSGLGENIVEAAELERSTTAIPARPGISFGFEFTVQGEPRGAELELTTIVVFPPPGLLPPGASEPVTSSAMPMRVRLGGHGLHYRGYTFDYDWEVAPGPWRFELRAGDRLLAVQSFVVTQESSLRR